MTEAELQDAESNARARGESEVLALVAEVRKLRAAADAFILQIAPAVSAKARATALEEAARVADRHAAEFPEPDEFSVFEVGAAMDIADAIRALATRSPE